MQRNTHIIAPILTFKAGKKFKLGLKIIKKSLPRTSKDSFTRYIVQSTCGFDDGY